MIDLKTLPKRPEEALSELLRELDRIVPNTPWNMNDFRRNNRNLAADVEFVFRAASIAAGRVADEELRSTGQQELKYSPDEKMSDLRARVERAQNALIVSQFDQHFLDDEDVEDFDFVTLTNDDKAEIRDLLAKARRLTENAEYLTPNHKRRIIHRIANVESELFKEVSGFKAFLEAAADISGLVKKFGEDAQPLADAIQTARTVTERKVEGYKQIAAEERPKAIAPPKD